MEFSPELPYQKKDILEAMPMASLRKTYVIYKTAFWLKKVKRILAFVTLKKFPFQMQGQRNAAYGTEVLV